MNKQHINTFPSDDYYICKWLGDQIFIQNFVKNKSTHPATLLVNDKSDIRFSLSFFTETSNFRNKYLHT